MELHRVLRNPLYYLDASVVKIVNSFSGRGRFLFPASLIHVIVCCVACRRLRSASRHLSSGLFNCNNSYDQAPDSKSLRIFARPDKSEKLCGKYMEIKDAKYLTSSPSFDKCPKPDRPEFAFIGRSNVGKSSLINMLCNNSKLAKISATPGKTQLINHFEIKSISGGKEKQWYLVDLPGYGFAKVSQRSRRRWEQMIENYIRKRENLVHLFVLIDSRHSPQKIDLDFINKLGEWRKSFALVFTKSDKNKPLATERNVNSFMQALENAWEAPPPFFITSAFTKEGRDEILNYINMI